MKLMPIIMRFQIQFQKELKDKSKEVYNKYIELDKKNNMLRGKNRILNEQLRRTTIRLVVRTYSDSEISNAAKL
jgi:tRNA splicing ligase